MSTAVRSTPPTTSSVNHEQAPTEEKAESTLRDYEAGREAFVAMAKTIISDDGKLIKKLSRTFMDKLAPFVKDEQDAKALANMNRHERRKFYSKNKHRIARD